MPRTIRELTIQPKADNSSTSTRTLPELLVRGVRIMISRKPGTTSIRSTNHISARSRQPPK